MPPPPPQSSHFENQAPLFHFNIASFESFDTDVYENQHKELKNKLL